ncbi:MAG: preprotein translocase subunit SecA [Campylobacterota bacterium]|nr:preprotein translocase subunit SecA [Campylobacterota bacterium]
MLKIFSKIFGTRNDKEVKKYKKRVDRVNALESKYTAMSDSELQESFNALKVLVQNEEKLLDEVIYDSFAITREAAKRTLEMRHYDVQIIGGMVLHDGRISEMKTGEGKTLVATLPVVLNAMTGLGVHVVTVNDYLASRDAKELEPLYNFLGYSVGAVTGDLQGEGERKKAYGSDIVYGTNNEFGFDFLRDNMYYSLEEKVQRGHNFVIVDEVDSILIDEARTPLIISGPTNKKGANYNKAHEIALKLEKGEKIEATKPEEEDKISGDFIVDEKNKVVLLTEEGIEKAQELFDVDNLYSLENASLSHNLDQALKASYIFEKDVDYVVQNNEVVIVDEFTGRLSEGRRYSDGLHQALEAKENVAIQEESQTLADVTFQNYFRMYDKLSGMTGTAQTEATEFAEIYGLDVVSIPTNVKILRDDKNDLIYKSEKEKFDAVCARIKAINKTGQPILVGTASIEKSEYLHALLKKEKIPHTVLNAKQHDKEGKIVEDAGQKGAVTIATNMAGRGVDIKLPKECLDLGGLVIIGTERHESRRIDNQLRGRAGRQGDVGESQFYLSLEDNLLRIFGSDKIAGVMNRLGLEEGEHIESGMVTRAVENAQKKVENMHFESRKHLLEYDDVANEQRKVIYNFRDNLLDQDYDIGVKIDENIVEFAQTIIENAKDVSPSAMAEDLDYNNIILKLKEELNVEISKEDIESNDFDVIEQKLVTILKDTYEEKMSVPASDQRDEIERVLYLQVLDNSYRDHLYAMDTLKTGIGLRGYNQKDPLVEYKKESYNMFIELISSIKYEIIRILFSVQLRDEEEARKEQEALERLKEQMESSVEDISLSSEEKKPVIEKKIPRNAPCPCGSGKKYKQCCGQSGPKKGVLAK